VLLGHPSARATINFRDNDGETALWAACQMGRGGVVRALLENGADPTIAHNDGTTPMAIAKQGHTSVISVEGRRECVAALEVRLALHFPSPSDGWLRREVSYLDHDMGESEWAYQIWKARQVADQQGTARWRCRGGGGAWR
jgi:ankyrin repeat protein